MESSNPVLLTELVDPLINSDLDLLVHKKHIYVDTKYDKMQEGIL